MVAMTAEEHFRAGNLKAAIAALNEQIRKDPLNVRHRTFLFELLCFTGEYDRCEKQLELLAQGGTNAELGPLAYRAALQAERARKRFFDEKQYLDRPVNPGSLAGIVNGRSVKNVSDADPRIGARLEVFLGGGYMWVPFEHITSITIEPPKRLRDLIWISARVHTADSFQGCNLGDVLVPVLSPGTWQHSEDEVKLGHVTVWESQEDGSVLPFGQKMWLVDGEEIPILELRNLQLGMAAAA